MTKGVLKNFANFSGKHLRCSHFLIKQRVFWPATLLKKSPTQVLSCEYFEIFKNAYFEVETLENEIYSCFLMSAVIQSLLGKVKKGY